MALVKKRKKWSVTCDKCGHENHAIKVYCEKCGTRIKGIVTPLSPDSRMPTST
jgi:uncharacterized OB-fold protein